MKLKDSREQRRGTNGRKEATAMAQSVLITFDFSETILRPSEIQRPVPLWLAGRSEKYNET